MISTSLVVHFRALFCACLVVLPGEALGQRLESVSGVVWDVTGAPISNVSLAFDPVAPATGPKHVTTSDDSGLFSVAGLSWGEYRLEAILLGYERVGMTVRVGPDGIRDLPIVLAAGHLAGPLRRLDGMVEGADGLQTTVVVYDLHGRFHKAVSVEPSGRFVVENLYRKPYLMVALGPGIAGSVVTPDVGAATTSTVTIRVAKVSPPLK